MKSLLLVLIASFMIPLAHADALPKPDCPQPVIPNPLASDLIKQQYEKKKAKYTKCVNKFVDEQQAISKTSADVNAANAAHDAAELAIKDFNDYMAELNATVARANSMNGADPEDDEADQQKDTAKTLQSAPPAAPTGKH